MKIFEGIDLTDSFVLSWRQSPTEILFNLEASIWPQSEYYEEPIDDEITCYKPATLIFKNVDEVSGLLEMSEVRPFSDASGEKDYGNIDSLEQINNGYRVVGEFGSVLINGGSVLFEISET